MGYCVLTRIARGRVCGKQRPVQRRLNTRTNQSVVQVDVRQDRRHDSTLGNTVLRNGPHPSGIQDPHLEPFAEQKN